jgi:hypothetical protein
MADGPQARSSRSGGSAQNRWLGRLAVYLRWSCTAATPSTARTGRDQAATYLVALQLPGGTVAGERTSLIQMAGPPMHDALGRIWRRVTQPGPHADDTLSMLERTDEVTRDGAAFNLVPCQNSRMGSELVFSVPVRLLSGTR